ncbi:hypothetical protein C8R43DRAFT_1133875 [Mycena crocata]|nr:hypothetical protein C8R43DRAFT_1133875 [Mycena crocata]
MPFDDPPNFPAQTHPVKLSPPSFHGLSIWVYLASAFIVISTIYVFCYASYSFYHSLTLNNLSRLPQYSVKLPSEEKKKTWLLSRSSSSQEQPILSDACGEHDSLYQVDSSPLKHAASHGHIPAIAFPSPVVSAPSKPRTVPTYDMHNIRFASPSNATIYNNIKLAPVVGSAVPFSYDSHNNLFPNPFTPATTTRESEPGERVAASLSLAFRCKSKKKGTSRAFGKENYETMADEKVTMKPLY